jgi:hypothetical protein
MNTVLFLAIIWAFSALLPLLAEGFSGPAAGYSGLRDLGCPGFLVCSIKPTIHVRRQSLGREPDRTAAVVWTRYERIERIGFSSWRLAIRAARVPQLSANFKRKVVTETELRKIVFCCCTSNWFAAVHHVNV